MALRNDYRLKFGVTIKDAYIKIESIQGSKKRMTVTIGVYNIVDGEHMLVNRYNIEKPFEPNLGSTANLFEQAYIHLKRLDDYADSVDA